LKDTICPTKKQKKEKQKENENRTTFFIAEKSNIKVKWTKAARRKVIKLRNPTKFHKYREDSLVRSPGAGKPKTAALQELKEDSSDAAAKADLDCELG